MGIELSFAFQPYCASSGLVSIDDARSAALEVDWEDG